MSLRKVTASEFLTKLEDKPLEDINTVKLIENHLKEKRGYVFKMPKPGEEVILLVSGGLDSIVGWNLLMEDYGLKVLPLTINRGLDRSNAEKKALDFFSDYFARQYPKLFVKPFVMDVPLKEIKVSLENLVQTMHPASILENIDINANLKTNPTLGSFVITPLLGKLYCQYLYLTQYRNISTIFCTVTSSDLNLPEQTFTALRSGMWNMCTSTNNYKWQFTSIALEKEIGVYYSKADLVSWGAKHHLPMEKSWTCYHDWKYQCGDHCITCITRRNAFKQAGVKDQTIYQCDQHSLSQKITHTLKIIARKLVLTGNNRFKKVIDICTGSMIKLKRLRIR